MTQTQQKIHLTQRRLMADMARTLNGALAYAKSQVGKSGWRRLCLAFVRQSWGYPTSGIATAYTGSKLVKKTTKGTPPPGAICWWKGPTSAGHVALSAGNGYVYSNDFKRPGIIDKVKIKDITRGWNCEYLGWSRNYPKQANLPLDGVSTGGGSGGGSGSVGKGTTGPGSRNTYKVGARVVVTTPNGLKARTAPGTESSTDSGRTVDKGYQIKITAVAEEDGIQWGKGTKYWYALVKRNGSVKDTFYVKAVK